MKKKIVISIIAFFIFASVFLIFQNRYNKVGKVENENDQVCEVDSDCTGVILECGSCVLNYSFSINKKYFEKYFEIYEKKCGDNRNVCDAMPTGKSSCKNKKCVLVEEVK